MNRIFLSITLFLIITVSCTKEPEVYEYREKWTGDYEFNDTTYDDFVQGIFTYQGYINLGSKKNELEIEIRGYETEYLTVTLIDTLGNFTDSLNETEYAKGKITQKNGLMYQRYKVVDTNTVVTRSLSGKKK